jgi:biotin transport system substrate-specific component
MTPESFETGFATHSRAAYRSAWLPRAVGALGFAVLTAVGARLAGPLPGTAVPFTLQAAAVLLAGFVLGPRLGAASQTLYLAAGLAGLPVFAAGGGAAYLLGPTGGYLLAFPVGAAVAGLVAGRWNGLPGLFAGGALGVLAIHAGGVSWLALAVGQAEAVRLGAAPFVVADALQIGLATLVAWRARDAVRRLLG